MKQYIDLHCSCSELVIINKLSNIILTLVSRETVPIHTGVKLDDLIRRPQLTYEGLAPFDPSRPRLPDEVGEQVEVRIKYEGYIKKQLAQAEKLHRIERKKIPYPFDYTKVNGLRLEAIEKLNKVQPENVGQASRISGVNPADITALLIFLERKEHTDD